MIRRPPRSTLDRSSAASDVYKRQILYGNLRIYDVYGVTILEREVFNQKQIEFNNKLLLSLIHISEPTRPY